MITCILIIWPLVTFENYFCNSCILHKRTHVFIKLHIGSYCYKYIQSYTYQHMHYISYILWYNLTPRVSQFGYFKQGQSNSMSIPAGNGATGALGTGPALGYLLKLLWFNSLFILISENNMNTCTYLVHTLSLIYIMKLLVIFGIKIYRKLPRCLTDAGASRDQPKLARTLCTCG
jgi:hypothetical protein